MYLQSMYAAIILISVFVVAQIFLRSTGLHAIRWQAWFGLYAAGTFFDVTSTYRGLTSLGIVSESNPTARFLLERMDISQALLMHGTISLLVILIAGYYWGEHKDWGLLTRCVIFTIAIGRFMAAINNIVVA